MVFPYARWSSTLVLESVWAVRPGGRRGDSLPATAGPDGPDGLDGLDGLDGPEP